MSNLSAIMSSAFDHIRDERLRYIAEHIQKSNELRSDMESALRQCQAELASIHAMHGDRENAEAHSAGLRMANAVLARIEPK